MRRLLCLAAIAAASVAGRAHATCTPTRMLMVVDKSSSMTETVDGTGKSKWQLATEAITSVANSYQNKIDLGINIFPNPSQCAPGKTLVEPGPGHASAIIAALGGPPPAGGNYTPMSQSIDVAVADAYLKDASRRPSILLVTDGWQWCSPYDPSTRTWPIDSVSNARAMGIKVYVVGFGSSVDVWTLNQMAATAGTARPGCDPDSSSMSGNNCYYQADSGADLTAALNAISVTVSTEICDGLDNDCNGLIDENLTRACSTSCGAGTQVCNAGVWSACSAPSPQTEICDGKDNNCNGTIDEGCACQPGQTKACGGTGLGACAQGGTQTCQANGQWGPCNGAGVPGVEQCNGIDDDCNGIVDDGDLDAMCPGGFCGDDHMCHSNSEVPPPASGPMSMPDPCEGLATGCSCTPGDARSCVGLLGACAVGGGVQPCTADGNWGACQQNIQPVAETCDGIDNDCDGIVDDHATCPGGGTCGSDGRCHGGDDGFGDDPQTQQAVGCSLARAPSADLLACCAVLLLALGAARRRIARASTKR